MTEGVGACLVGAMELVGEEEEDQPTDDERAEKMEPSKEVLVGE